MTLSEISAWANKYHLKVTYDSEYDDTIKEGKVKRSNIKNGDTIDQGLEIHIILSKGKLKMINYGDNDANKIKEFAKKYNLPIEVTDEFSDDIAAGKIIKVSHKPNAIIKNSDTIKLTISKGKATKIPNFVGMSLSEAKKSCSSNKLSCSYEYAYSDESEDTIIYQNKASGQQVIENAGLVLTVSKGSAPEGESNYTPPTNKQSNSSGSNNQKPAPVVKPTCKTGKLLFGAGSTGGQTKAMMQEANSKIGASITYTFVTSCSNGDTANGSVCPESTAYYGATLSSCNSYKAVIVNY